MKKTRSSRQLPSRYVTAGLAPEVKAVLPSTFPKRVVTIAHHGDVHVVTDAKPKTRAEREQLKDLAEAYLEQAEQVLELDGRRDEPLVLGILTQRGMDGLWGYPVKYTSGACVDANVVALRDSTGGADGEAIIAHELRHTVTFGHQLATGQAMPEYLVEGIAEVTGAGYLDRTNREAEGPIHQKAVSWMVDFTARDAEVVFGHDEPKGERESKRVNGWRRMQIGAQFIEWLRVHLGGAGVPDVVARFDQLEASLSPECSFEQAFAEQLGVPLREAQDAFIVFLEHTRDDAPARFRGTIWEDTWRIVAASK
ncbi:MAG: hypothetical protein IPJ65_26745 [Archangiaceae bacterium]|nr:hypothetical protein [Archangiaceae bacterium]